MLSIIGGPCLQETAMEHAHEVGKGLLIDPLWLISGLIAVVGAGVGWFLVRLDEAVDDLQKDIIELHTIIGALQNADTNCTREQTVIKTDLSMIRDTILRLVPKRKIRLKRSKHKRAIT
jgi:hypothetical protein